MKKFYIAWKATPSNPLPPAPFEYLIHPGEAHGGAMYFNALIDSESKQDAFDSVARVFPNAQRQLAEVADTHRLKTFAETKRMTGVKVVKSKD